MLIYGITGQSGAGKGECSKILARYGFSVIDADVVYHNLLNPPSKCLDELVFHFGRGILTAGGLLNRETLGKMVFGKENADRLSILNEITHKHVCREIKRILSSLKAVGCERALIDAPLLIESGLCRDCDKVICVVAEISIRFMRIMSRDNITEEAAELRISSQKPNEFYTEKSDYTVNNSSDIASLTEQIEKILTSEGLIDGTK